MTKRLRRKLKTDSIAALAFGLLSCAEPKTQPASRVEHSPAYNRLLFAGDVMFCRGVRRQILAAHDPAMPFRKLAPLMAAADITFVNLESPFSDKGPYNSDGLVFHAEPQMIAGLELAGVDIASTANNHARDSGSHGVEYTIRWLRAHGITPLGSSESCGAAHSGVVLTRGGVRFGFLGYTYDQQNGNWHDIDDRIALADPTVLCRDITALKRRADLVIVSMHHGIEYMSHPSKAQIEFAHSAIDAGAAVVIGHHPHVIQREEHYKDGLIFYSLGNFVFDQYQREATQHGEMVEISFLGTQFLTSRALPVRIVPSGPELEGLTAGRELDVSTELRAHGGKDLLRKRVLAP
ncbi:MAG: CapA family protein [Acidobacteriaceae bacterium]|nr:CapA family protein [Acidobacteriaceae bacterium]